MHVAVAISSTYCCPQEGGRERRREGEKEGGQKRENGSEERVWRHQITKIGIEVCSAAAAAAATEQLTFYFCSISPESHGSHGSHGLLQPLKLEGGLAGHSHHDSHHSHHLHNHNPLPLQQHNGHNTAAAAHYGGIFGGGGGGGNGGGGGGSSGDNMVDGIMSSAFGFTQDSLSKMTSMTNSLSLPTAQAASGMYGVIRIS